MTTYGSCCYAECPNSYSTDSYAVFFKFPLEPARRKKWLENCGNPELPQLADRQLRGKRVCARHFLPIAFVNPATKEALTDKAIPMVYRSGESTKSAVATTVSAVSDEEEVSTPVATPDNIKRGRGRPRTKIQPSITTIKKESKDTGSDHDYDVNENESGEDSDAPTTSRQTKEKPKSKVTPTTGVAVTPVNGTGRRPGRPPGRKSTLSASIPAVPEETDKAKVTSEKGKPEEVPGPSGSRSTRSGKADDKPSTDIVETPATAMTKFGLRKSLTSKLDVEEATLTMEKDRRSLRQRAVKIEPEEEPPYKKAKSPAAVATVTKLIIPPVKILADPPRTPIPNAELKYSAKKTKSEDEPVMVNKEAVETSTKDRSLLGSAKKEIKTIEKFLLELKTQCVLSDQWTLSGVLWDPGHKMKMIAASEMDVTSVGSMRLKRCVQIFEDLSVKVLVDDMNMTCHFDAVKVSGPVDVAQLVTRVAMAKICPGLKTFEAQDSTYFPMALKRGGNWYSADCPVIVDHTMPGPLCSTCARLRSSIRRRKIREKMDMEKKQSKLLIKVQSKFGKALYTLLTDLMTDDGTGARKLHPIRPPSQHQSVSSTSSGPEIELDKLSKEGGESSEKNGLHQGASKGGLSAVVGKKVRVNSKVGTGGNEDSPKQKARGGPRTGRVKNVLPSQTTEHVTLSSGTEGQNEGVVEMLEQYVTIEGDNGNLILQPSSGEFTLAEGEEYELIGEHDPNQPLQVMDTENPHQTIEIIEVDDQTMAQLTGHNMNEMFFQGSENIQVTEIDPSDPNMGQLLKVIDHSHGFAFQ